MYFFIYNDLKKRKLGFNFCFNSISLPLLQTNLSSIVFPFANLQLLSAIKKQQFS